MKHSPIKKILFSVLCFVISVSLLPLHTAAAGDTSVHVTGDAIYQYAWDVLDRINAERTAQGLSPVEMDAVLLDAAMQRALECAVYYDHTRPDGSDCFSVTNWRGWVGENIAVGYGSPDAVMDGWMNSQGHRENILRSNFTSVGVGVFQYNGTLFWAQFFDAGTPRSVDRSDQTQTITRTVSLSQAYVSLSTSQDTAVNLGKGETFQIGSVRNTNAGWSYTSLDIAAEDLAYTSADTGVATVSDSGVISPVGNGSTTISVFLPGCEDKALEYTVTVQGMDAAPVLMGDVTGDGRVTVRDIATLRLYLAGNLSQELTDAQLEAGDIVADGRITIRDVAYLRLLIAGKITK